ncbi:MAG TPA: glycosyltransferase [Bryobacteraceae bacterium]|nr:glycosyltransferase [Bryobacteraceae bacterium]
MARALGLGGSERQLAEMAKALDRDEFEPHVACFHDDGFRAEELRVAGVPLLPLPVRSLVSSSAIHGAMQLGRYVRRHEIQIVHTFDVPLNLFGVPAASFFRAPRVISSQRAFRELTPGLHHHLLRLTDRLVDAIVVNCEAVRQDLITNDRVPASLIHLCYNGIDTDRFQPLAAPRPAPLADATIVIGTVCAVRPEKGLETLLEAFARLAPYPGLRLAIVGSGPWLPQLEALAARLGIADACLFQSATSEVPEWLHAIDIFVLPSLSEALSNSLMEAMACGCAAVASSVGGNPELVKHLETGLLFRPRDSADLAGCLDLLIRDATLRRRLAMAAAERIHTQFTIRRAACRLAEIYRRVLNAA